MHPLLKSSSPRGVGSPKSPTLKRSLEFSKHEYWSGLPFPSPGALPNPGIEPRSPALQADSLPAEPQGKSPSYCKQCCSERWSTCVFFNNCFLRVYAQQWDCWVIWQFYSQFLKEFPYCSLCSALGLLLCLVCGTQCSCDHKAASVFKFWFSSYLHPGVGLLDPRYVYVQFFRRTFILFA